MMFFNHYCTINVEHNFKMCVFFTQSEIVPCEGNITKCGHGCLTTDEGSVCVCPEGSVLQEKGHACTGTHRNTPHPVKTLKSILYSELYAIVYVWNSYVFIFSICVFLFEVKMNHVCFYLLTLQRKLI